MIVHSHIRVTEQIELILFKAKQNKLVSDGEYNKMLADLSNATQRVVCGGNSIMLSDMRFFRFYDDTLRFSEQIGEPLGNFDGWHLYDPNLWLYESSSKNKSGEAMELESASDWFETQSVIVDGVKKRAVFVRYPKEIDEVIRKGGQFYFLKRRIVARKEKAPKFSPEELEEFDKIITIENKKTGTLHYYGAWY